MIKFTVILKSEERAALIELAQRERRDPRSQAACLIRDGLQVRGLLPTDTPPISSSAQPQQPQGVLS